VLVRPDKSRGIVEWFRKRFGERHKPGAAVITKSETRPPAKNSGRAN
jgi:hypothetical protein